MRSHTIEELLAPCLSLLVIVLELCENLSDGEIISAGRDRQLLHKLASSSEILEYHVTLLKFSSWRCVYLSVIDLVGCEILTKTLVDIKGSAAAVERKLRIGILVYPTLPHSLPLIRLARDLRKAGHYVELIIYQAGWRNLNKYKIITALLIEAVDRVNKVRPETKDESHWYNPGSMCEDPVWQELAIDVNILISDAIYRFAPYWALSRNIKSISFYCGMPEGARSSGPSSVYITPACSPFKKLVCRILQELRRGREDRVRYRKELKYIKTVCVAYDLAIPKRAMGNFYFSNGLGKSVAPMAKEMEFEFTNGDVQKLPLLHPMQEDSDWTIPSQELVEISLEYAIVISFGTTGLLTNRERRWLPDVSMAVANQFPDASVFVALPDYLIDEFSERIGELPNNLNIQPWLPLYEFLYSIRCRKVLVCHGGMNSYRDAVATGTPIVAIPKRYDQFGISARINSLGFGVSIRARNPGLNEIYEAIDETLFNDERQKFCKRMARQIRQNSDLSWVDDLLL